MTTIKKCSCKDYKGNKSGATFQDALYGENLRVFNKTAGESAKYRCTICSKEISSGETKKGK